MSRFSNLEFGNEAEGECREDHRVKDEGFYVAEADHAFREADFEKALQYYAKVLEFNPDRASAWVGQVQALIELEEFREAKVWADKALERFPHEPELLAAKAVALGRCGDLEGALAFSDASIEERGEVPYLWLARGDVLLAREEKRADYCFEKALALAPRDWFTAWLGARIRYFYKQFGLALRLAQQALEWNATQAAVWVQVGLCQHQLGLVAPARASLRQAQELNPRCPLLSQGRVAVAHDSVGARLRGIWRRLFSV